MAVSSLKSYHDIPSGSLSGILPLKVRPDSSLIPFFPDFTVHPHAKTEKRRAAANKADPIFLIGLFILLSPDNKCYFFSYAAVPATSIFKPFEEELSIKKCGENQAISPRKTPTGRSS